MECPYAGWGKELGKMIGRTEQRVASYRKMVQTEYVSIKKAGLDTEDPENRELINLLKDFEGDEMIFLKYLRKEKTAWNEGENV